MAQFQPVPAWAQPFISDDPEELNRLGLKFNPVWLQYFLELIQTLNEAGGTSIIHNMLTGLQGGTTDEYYHLSLAVYNAVLAGFGNQSANTVFSGPASGAAAAPAFRALVTDDLANQLVTYAKVQNVTDARLLGRSAGSAGSPMEITVGGGLTLSAGALTAPLLSSGTYTPTLTNVANLDGSTAFSCQYLRLGASVTVSGKVSVDPTLTATATALGISLPIASAFTSDNECGGTAFASAIASQGAAILADAANDRAEMQWISTDITDQPMFFSFTYRVL